MASILNSFPDLQQSAINEEKVADLPPRMCRSAVLLHASAMSLLFEMMGESEWQTAFKYKNATSNPILDSRRHSVQAGMPPNGRPLSAQQPFGHRPHLMPASVPLNAGTDRSYGLFAGSPRKKVSLPVRAASSEQHAQLSMGRRLLTKTEKAANSSGSSSRCVSSSSSSGSGYKSYKRFTVPSITTTITTDSSECAASSSSQQPSESLLRNVDHHFLYADSAPSQSTAAAKPPPPSKAAVRSRLFRDHKTTSVSSHRPLSNQASGSNEHPEKTSAHPHGTVRRVASFTYSGDSSSGKNSKTAIGGGKKFNFATISKIGQFIRGKVDAANSTSVLYPTREEVRKWQESFESLLRDKYGCNLFRQFVTREVSSENLDFYEEVEEFKKLKAGKKSTIQRAHEIYERYFDEGAAKELNLDSSTKKATKTQLEQGALPDTFNLAQTRIGQLMAKDSYRRFLQSQSYLSLLQTATPPPSASTERKVIETTSAPSSACTPDSEPSTNFREPPAPMQKSKSVERANTPEIIETPAEAVE